LVHKIIHFSWHAVKHTALHVIIPNVLRLIVLPVGCAVLGMFGLDVNPIEAAEHLLGESPPAVEHVAQEVTTPPLIEPRCPPAHN
jgi:hypothetical protein